MQTLLIKLNACQDAIDWVGGKSLQEAWDTCPRGDWMLWLYKRLYPDNLREFTLTKAHCANTVRHLMTDERSLKAVDTAIAFGEGRVTREELDEAYAAAYAYAAAADAAAYADADAAAAAAADAAAYAADAAAYAAAAAYADADAVAVAKALNQKQTADICRQYLRIDYANLTTR